MSVQSSAPSGTDPVPAVPREIEALRALLDARLAALEAALIDPSQSESLESLIFDLARIATEEVDATTRQVVLEAQRNAQAAVARAQAHAQTSLESERATVASLRQELEQAQAALQAEQSAAAGRDRDLETAREAIEQEQEARAGLRREFEDAKAVFEAQAEQAAAQALQQGLDEAQAALEAEQAAAAAAREGLEQAQLALSNEQQAAALVRQELEQAQAVLEAERATAAEATRELDSARLALDQEQNTSATLRREFEEVRASSDTGQGDAAQLRDTVARLEQELAAARAQSSSDSGGLSAALSDANAKVEAAAHDRVALVGELEAARQAAASAETEARARYEELRDATEQQIKALELAVRQAEDRASAAEGEAEQHRGAARASKSPAAPAAAVQPVKPVKPVKAAPTPAPVAAAYALSRQASRYVMSSEVQIQVDGTQGWLIDLSSSGAQVLASIAMKPNRLVKVALPVGDKTLSLKGKIVWARIEPAQKGGALKYRAGVFFNNPDVNGLEAFLTANARE